MFRQSERLRCSVVLTGSGYGLREINATRPELARHSDVIIRDLICVIFNGESSFGLNNLEGCSLGE